MTRGVRVRLIAFVVLASVGIVYVAGTYLGLVDRVLGRGLAIHATLPDSGGLFAGSEVTYRGVKVGTVKAMHVTREGLRADLALEEGTRVPLDSEIYVHNLSAVGEQYLDIEPSADEPPYAEDGDTLEGGPESLPTDEGDLLLDLDEFVGSVDKRELNTVITELGTTFRGTASPLQRMVDGGRTFLSEAIANEQATYQLMDNGLVVLRTQDRNGENIRSFARDLADLTATVRRRDPELRVLLENGGSALHEVDLLMKGLEPTLPSFVSDLTTLNQITVARLAGVEQLLVTFPAMVAGGFTGTPGDGYGHINLQFDNSVGPCRKGYMPVDQWRPTSDLTDTPTYPARCAQGAPFNQRGSNYAPPPSDGSGARVAPYDPRTRLAHVGSGTVGDVMIGSTGGLQTVFGDSSWRWMLVGPLEQQAAAR